MKILPAPPRDPLVRCCFAVVLCGFLAPFARVSAVDLNVDPSLKDSPYPITASASYANANVATTTNVNAAVNHSAGTLTLGGTLSLTTGANSTSTYTLGGTGSLVSDTVRVGIAGTGTFNQTNGAVSSQSLFVGANSGITGSYNLSAGSLTVAQAPVVGLYGKGIFTQTGGTVALANTSGTAQLLYLGYFSSGQGTYHLDGGTLTPVGVHGSTGTSEFDFGENSSDTTVGTLQAGADNTTFLRGLTHIYIRGKLGAQIDSNGHNIVIPQILERDPAYNGTFAAPLAKLGAGTLTLTAANTYVGSTYVTAGSLAVAGGGQVGAGVTGPASFYVGSSTAGGTSPAASLSDAGSAITVASLQLGNTSGGSFTLNGGTLHTNQTVVGTGGPGTFTQTGGTHTANSSLLLANSSGAPGTYNLNGGTLAVGYIQAIYGTTSAFNFNGGTLQSNATAQANSSKYFIGILSANVQAGGALIDTNGFNLYIQQPLLHDASLPGGTTDGGLTKLGAGTLTLSGANTFTGPTAVRAGTLALAFQGTLANSASLSVDIGTTLDVSQLSNPFTVANGQTLTLNGNCTGANGPGITVSGTLTGTGTVSGSVGVSNGGSITGPLTINGSLSVNQGGTVALNGGTLTLQGQLNNYGTIRLEHGAALTVAGGYLFTNYGTLDVITGSFSAPTGFQNHGVVIDSSVVKTRSVTMNAGTVTVTVDGYDGHTYQLQSRAALDSGSYAPVANVPIQSGVTGQTLTFTDPTPAAGQGFYRVQVDP